jgi:hypothetical protein
MKKIALVGLVTLCSVGAYAQGVVQFLSYLSGSVDGEVYAPTPATPGVEKQGPTAAQIATAGYTTDASYPAINPVTYGGAPIGGSSYVGATPVSFAGAGSQVYTYGNLFTAELYAISTGTTGAMPSDAYVPGAGTGGTALAPVTQYQSFFNTTTSSGTGAGYFQQANPAIPDPGIPGTGWKAAINTATKGKLQYLGNSAAAAVVAWYSGGGQFTTLAAAQAAGVPWGTSSIFEIAGLIEPASVMAQAYNNNAAEPAQNGSAYLSGIDGNTGLNTAFMSFSLTSVPEPSTIALGVIGACAFLARRRKK